RALSRSGPARSETGRYSQQFREFAFARGQNLTGDLAVRGSVAARSQADRGQRKSPHRQSKRHTVQGAYAEIILLTRALHLNLDDAWRDEPLKLPAIDARNWGARLRFSASSRLVKKFHDEYALRLAPFILYGSGDFHYLSALWLRRLTQPVVLVSFDNHPDWDVRPPKWGCGGWINRALALAHVQHIAIWGCGNFECWWPRNTFANRAGEREGRLEVHPWADNRPMKDRQRRGAILRDNWRDHFEVFVASLGRADVYVTIDLDCLRAKDAVTNWESGRFTTPDLEWS